MVDEVLFELGVAAEREAELLYRQGLKDCVWLLKNLGVLRKRLLAFIVSVSALRRHNDACALKNPRRIVLRGFWNDCVLVQLID